MSDGLPHCGGVYCNDDSGSECSSNNNNETSTMPSCSGPIPAQEILGNSVKKLLTVIKVIVVIIPIVLVGKNTLN